MTFRKLRAVLLVALAGLGLASCSSGVTPNFSGQNASLAPGGGSAVETVAKARPAPVVKVAAPAKTVSVSMPSVIGAPKGVAGKMKKKLSGKLTKRNVRFVNGAAAYKLRGYLAASPENGGVKVAYIWDVSNKAGKRQHRIIGEEFVTKGNKNKPWKSVNDKVLNQIARRTANDLSGWLAKRSGSSVQVATSEPRRRVTANRIPKRAIRGAGATKSAASRSAKRTVMAMVVPVSGAPGDGKVSLTKAIKNRLFKQGVRLTSQRTDSVYQVRGLVQMSQAGPGKQAIRIDWKVYDPRGKRLGVVTQKNNIPANSLNGKWGAIADAAAGAAADGIIKLLPKSATRVASN